jgi:hypothetical protein
VIKLLHELGMTPIPYVEASAWAVFSEKSRLMGVADAGMAVEVLIASLALFLWLNVEAGSVSNAPVYGSRSQPLQQQSGRQNDVFRDMKGPKDTRHNFPSQQRRPAPQ